MTVANKLHKQDYSNTMQARIRIAREARGVRSNNLNFGPENKNCLRELYVFHMASKRKFIVAPGASTVKYFCSESDSDASILLRRSHLMQTQIRVAKVI